MPRSNLTDMGADKDFIFERSAFAAERMVELEVDGRDDGAVRPDDDPTLHPGSDRGWLAPTQWAGADYGTQVSSSSASRGLSGARASNAMLSNRTATAPMDRRESTFKAA